MKVFKRGVCKACVFGCILMLALLLGSIFEGMMAPFAAVGAGLILLLCTDGVCRLLLSGPVKPERAFRRKNVALRFEVLASRHRPGFHSAA